MAATKFEVGEKRKATVSFVDKNGRPANVDGVPEWASTNPGTFTVTPAADGLSATVECVAIGTSQVSCVADADLDEGETRELTVLGDVEGIPSEAVGGVMSFGPPL